MPQIDLRLIGYKAPAPPLPNGDEAPGEALWAEAAPTDVLGLSDTGKCGICLFGDGKGHCAHHKTAPGAPNESFGNRITRLYGSAVYQACEDSTTNLVWEAVRRG